MATQIFESSGLHVSTAARSGGPWLQFTTPTAGGYAVLNPAEVETLARKLAAWCATQRAARGDALEDGDGGVEARVLRKVAKALRENYTEPYCSMGGPADGDSHPGELDAERAAADLERMADEA